LRPSGLGAELNDLFEPCDLMKHLKDIGKVSDEEAYKTWNMGQGMLVITPEPEKVISISKERGIEAKVCGEIKKEKGIKIGGQTERDLIF